MTPAAGLRLTSDQSHTAWERQTAPEAVNKARPKPRYAASQSQMFNKHHRDQRVIGVGQVAGASPVIFDGTLSFGRRSVPRRGHNHNRFLPNRSAPNVFSFCRNPFYFDLAARMFSVIV